ncbi:MAG: tellurite resistance TerB family protein [Candidatus Kariarchaeaceae archaeon]|jgi:tellurite resistance protein
MSKDELLDKALKELVEVAFKDGVVDDAEWDMINQIEISLQVYADALDRALLDHVITREESAELENLRDKIMSDAKDVAGEDGVIDDEEKELLQTLTQILKKYRT